MRFHMQILLSILVILLPNSTTAQNDGYKVGDYVANFSLKNITGESVSLTGNAAAKGYVIIFTCNTCPYSKLYEERIIAIHNKYAPVGFPVLAINPNDVAQMEEDSFEEMKARAQEQGYTFPYLKDETQEVTRAFGATRTPQAFVLKKEGSKYKLVYIGAIDDNYRSAEDAKKKYVEDAIDLLIQGRKIPVNFTKAIGCTIKWKST